MEVEYEDDAAQVWALAAISNPPCKASSIILFMLQHHSCHCQFCAQWYVGALIFIA